MQSQESVKHTHNRTINGVKYSILEETTTTVTKGGEPEKVKERTRNIGRKKMKETEVIKGGKLVSYKCDAKSKEWQDDFEDEWKEAGLGSPSKAPRATQSSFRGAKAQNQKAAQNTSTPKEESSDGQPKSSASPTKPTSATPKSATAFPKTTSDPSSGGSPAASPRKIAPPTTASSPIRKITNNPTSSS